MDNDKKLYDKEFDLQYAYDGCDLGATCTPDRTVFKLWSPEASGVELFLYHQDDTGPWFGHWRLEPEDRGVWTCVIERDLHGVYYDYEVTVEGNTARTADPYAAACGRNGRRSMAVDLSRTDPEGFGEDAAPPLPP